MSDFSLYDLHPDLGRLEVLDLGAFEDPKTAPAYSGLMQAGRARVTGVEPNLAACLRLTRKYGAPHQFFPIFAGNGKPAKFHKTSRVQTGSLFEPNTPLLKVFHALHELTTLVSVSEVNTYRLDDVIQRIDVDYMKLDVQGSELDVLEGGEKLLESVVAMQIEVAFAEIYRGQPLFADIDPYLRKRGFWLHLFPGPDGITTMNPFPTGGRQVMWTDVVYTRHPLELGALSEAKLWKLALVLHDIYRSFDFAHLCLAEIDARAGGGLAETYRARLDQA